MGDWIGPIRVLFLLVFALPVAAQAAELTNYPGWFLEKIVQDSEDGVISEAPDYYTLKPGDGRAAITVSSSIARQLKNGEAEPESIYSSNKTGKKENLAHDSSAASSEEYVYGAQGIVQADPIYSTATADQQPSGYLARSQNNATPTSLAHSGQATSISELHNTFPPSAANSATTRNLASSSAGRKTNIAPLKNSGASVVPHAPVASNAAAAPSSAQVNDTKEAAAKGSADLSLSSNNTSATGSNSAKNDTASSNVVVPPCVHTRKIYDVEGVTRVGFPLGCTSITVTMWGAGGGSKTQSQEESANTISYKKTDGTQGKGGSYLMGSGPVDGKKLDLVVVVGASNTTGDGGGFSAVYSIPKSQGGAAQIAANLLAAVRGGVGASGAAGKNTSGAPGPFSSYTTEDAKKTTGAFKYAPDRGKAGNAGEGGKVILEIY